MFGGNPAGLSGHDREQGGSFGRYGQEASGGGYDSYVQGVGGGSSAYGPGVPGGQGPFGGNDSPKSAMEALAQGIAQLQSAMAMQMGLSAAKPEAIRPGTAGSDLPKLQEADEMAAINVGDWLHGLSGPMCDLTDGSSQWWAQLVAALDAYYQDYVNSSAVKKLQLRADDYAGALLREPRWLRVDKRAASMVLQAIPDTIRTEVLANRLQSTLSILARILTIYRPGSAVERQQVLKALETPDSSSTAMELVEALRRWARWLKRAQDLSLQVPDPSILLRGLDQASRSLLEKHGEVNFRTNMLRYSLELDSAPTLVSVQKLQSHLLAEFEQIAYRGRGKASASNTPVVKAMGTGAPDHGAGSSPKGPASPNSASTTTQKPCKFFVSRLGVSAVVASSFTTGPIYQGRNGVKDVRVVAPRGT